MKLRIYKFHRIFNFKCLTVIVNVKKEKRPTSEYRQTTNIIVNEDNEISTNTNMKIFRIEQQ